MAPPSTFKREFIDDVAEHSLMSHVTKLHKALLAHRDTLAKLCESNQYALDFICMA